MTHRLQLPNGITLLARANFNSPSINIGGYCTAGALLNPPHRAGLADFTAAALTYGAGARNFNQFHFALESLGASLGFDGGTHTTSFGGKALIEDLNLLLELLRDCLLHPIFPADGIERLRAQILASLDMSAQDSGDVAAQNFDDVVFANHPYSIPTEGTPHSVQSITRDDLIEFHRRAYGPNGFTLALVGGIEPQQALEKAARIFADWHNPEQQLPPPLPPVTPLTTNTLKFTALAAKTQSDLLLGCAGPARTNPDYLAASVGNNILGQFGMAGRLGDVVREQAGLAYSISSGLGGSLGPGAWSVYAAINPEDVQQAYDLIRAEIARFVSEPVSEDELADVKSNLIGRLPLSLETNGGMVAALLNIERHNLGADFYERYPALIEAITAEEILRAAQTYLHPDKLGIGIAGPEMPAPLLV